MGMTKAAVPDNFYKARWASLLQDDFEYYVDADLWTKLAADAGTSVAAGNYLGGKVYLTTGATDNNEATLYTTNKPFLFSNNKAIFGEWIIDYAEANTDDANVAVGFCSAPGANMLLDDGAGPAASFSGALIYKVDGGTVWKCVSSLGTTQTITTSTSTAGGTSQQVLRIEVNFPSSTVAEVTYFLNGVPLIDAGQTARNVPIKHLVTYASAAQMSAIAGYVKAGGANSEVLHVDLVQCAQAR